MLYPSGKSAKWPDVKGKEQPREVLWEELGGCLSHAVRAGDSMWYHCWGPGQKKLGPDRP